MQDMAFGYAATRPAMTQNVMPSLGLVVMLGLALASTVFGLGNPASVVAEYATATIAATEG